MSHYHRDGSQSGNIQNTNVALPRLYIIYMLYLVGYRTKDTKSIPLFFVHIATDPSFKTAKIFWCFVDAIYLIFQTAHQKMMIKFGKATGNESFTKLQRLYM